MTTTRTPKTSRGIELKLVDEKTLTAYLEKHKVKVPKNASKALKLEHYVDWAKEKVDDAPAGTEYGTCDNCKVPVDPELTSCPVCGTGGAEILTSGVTLVDTADLDASNMRIKELAVSMSTNYWRLGRELAESFARKLYKTRVDDTGKPKYKSWDQYAAAELPFEGTHARRIIAISERFTEEQLARFGVAKLELVARAPAGQQPRLLAEAETLTKRQLAEKVKGGRRTPVSGARSEALAAGTEAAKAARDARRQQVQDGGVTCVFQMGTFELPLRQLGEGQFITSDELVNGVRAEYTITTKGRRRILTVKYTRAQATPEAAQ